MADWTDQVADQIESAVVTVRGKTVVPAQRLVAYLLDGLFLLFLPGAGGQLMLTTDVENYPGFPDGIMGPELMEKFRAQAARFGAEYLTANAERVDFSSAPFGVWAEGREFRARTVIISTGASARMLGLESEARLLGHGLSTCATCDGFFFRGQEIAVVGGGDSAPGEATFLTRFATKVTLVHRRDTLRASKIMQDKARANPKIVWMLDSEVEEILDTGKGAVAAMVVRHNKTQARADLPGAGGVVAIGQTPNTSL